MSNPPSTAKTYSGATALRIVCARAAAHREPASTPSARRPRRRGRNPNRSGLRWRPVRIGRGPGDRVGLHHGSYSPGLRGIPVGRRSLPGHASRLRIGN